MSKPFTYDTQDCIRRIFADVREMHECAKRLETTCIEAAEFCDRAIKAIEAIGKEEPHD